MDESIRLGKVAGVKIGANWSLVVIFGLLVVSLAGTQLPHSAPGHASLAYALVALGTATIFYGCLLAHELAHALTARRRGVEVDGIVLWLLGGVSKLRGESGDAAGEVAIAAAGPAASVALAATFFALSRLAGGGLLPGGGLLAGGLGWLGWVNGALAAFNLLPAFPLDGGRVLRGALWHHRGDRQQATRTAARVGGTFGYGFVGLGAVGFLTGFGFNGLWLALIGWFVVSASRGELEATTLVTELAGLTVAGAMTVDPLTVPAWVAVDRLWDEGVQRRRLSTFPVVDPAAELVGVVTVASMRRLPAARWPWTPVAAITRPCVVCAPGEDLATVASRLAASPERCAVVVDGPRVVGILTAGDVERAAARPRVPQMS